MSQLPGFYSSTTVDLGVGNEISLLGSQPYESNNSSNAGSLSEATRIFGDIYSGGVDSIPTVGRFDADFQIASFVPDQNTDFIAQDKLSSTEQALQRTQVGLPGAAFASFDASQLDMFNTLGQVFVETASGMLAGEATNIKTLGLDKFFNQLTGATLSDALNQDDKETFRWIGMMTMGILTKGKSLYRDAGAATIQTIEPDRTWGERGANAFKTLLNLTGTPHGQQFIGQVLRKLGSNITPHTKVLSQWADDAWQWLQKNISPLRQLNAEKRAATWGWQDGKFAPASGIDDYFKPSSAGEIAEEFRNRNGLTVLVK